MLAATSLRLYLWPRLIKAWVSPHGSATALASGKGPNHHQVQLFRLQLPLTGIALSPPPGVIAATRHPESPTLGSDAELACIGHA